MNDRFPWLRFCLVLALGAACWWAGAPAHAQDPVSFRAEVDRTTVSLDGQLTLTLTVEGQVRNVPDPRLPLLEGFQVYSSGRSQQFSLVNGQFSASVAFRYVLQPLAVGQQTIGPAEITLDGQVYRSQPIEVEVLAGSVPTPTPPEQAPPGEAPSGLSGQDLFVEAAVDKERATLGEQVTYTFRFYQGVDLFGADLRYSKPETPGFWAEDLPPQNQYYQTVAGRRYLVTEVKMGLFATAAGPQTIGPASLQIESFFARRQTLQSQALTVEVVALPQADQPAGFEGAVGQYQVSAWLDKNETTVNEPVTLFYKVAGSGNVQLAPEPSWPELDGFRDYEAKSTTHSSVENYRVLGDKTFEKLLIPKEAGNYTLPAFRLVHFDPDAESYRIAETEPLTLTVRPGAPEADSPTDGNQQQAVTLVSRDIRHIKAAPPVLKDQGSHLYGSAFFWLAWLLPPLLVLGAVLHQRQRRRLRQDVRYARLRRAHKAARKRLAAARTRMKAGDEAAFYGEVAAALRGYLGDKMNAPPASLNLQQLERELAERGAEASTVERLHHCWETCDLGRFAPVSGGPQAMQDLLSEVETLVVSLEGLKWNAK